MDHGRRRCGACGIDPGNIARMRSLVFFTLFLIPTLTSAQTFGGIGARAEGMGGAFVAVADDATAVYWNPAGIASGATFDVQIARGEAAPGSTVFVGAVVPVLGLSLYRTHTVQGSPDRQNEGSGKVQIRTLTTSNAGITVVQTIVSTLVIGTTARMVRGGVDSAAHTTTVDFDAGALWSSGSGLRLGITGRNLRKPGFGSESETVFMDRQVRAGIAFAPRSLPAGVHGPLTVAFDADLTTTVAPEGNLRMAAFGTEYWLAQGRVGARAGVRWRTLGDAEQAFSGGLTVKLPRSVFVEGQLTKTNGDADADWTVAARVTF